MGPMFGTSTVGCCLGILAPSLGRPLGKETFSYSLRFAYHFPAGREQAAAESFTRAFRNVTARRPQLRELYMLQLLITLAAGVLGFVLTRSFVRRRLRFVDAVHSPIAPIVAGRRAHRAESVPRRHPGADLHPPGPSPGG